MMKKLLIFMLVLGVASTASAVTVLDDIRLDLSGTTLTVVGLTAGASFDGGIYDEAVTIESYTTPKTVNSNAGSLGAIDLFSGTGYNGFDITVGSTGLEDPAWPVVAGDWFTVEYSGDVGDVMQIYDYGVSATVAVGTLNIVPEPMTIALLGLGGLFLRRRK